MHRRLSAFLVAGAPSLVFVAACHAATVTTGPAEDIASDTATPTGIASGVAPGSTFHFEFWGDEMPQHVEQSVTEAVPSSAEVRVMQRVYAFSASSEPASLNINRLVVNEHGGVVLGQLVPFKTIPAGGATLPIFRKCQVARVIGRRLQAAVRLLHKPSSCRSLHIVIRPRQGGGRSRRDARVAAQSIKPGALIESSGTVVLRIAPNAR